MGFIHKNTSRTNFFVHAGFFVQEAFLRKLLQWIEIHNIFFVLFFNEWYAQNI